MSNDAMKEIMSHILERLDSIDLRLEAGGAKGAKTTEDATPMFKNDNDDWVYKTGGCNEMEDRDTGEAGFWVKTKHGKSIPVDVQGYPLWLKAGERPLATQ